MKKSIYTILLCFLFSGILVAQDRIESYEIDSLTGEFAARVTITPGGSNVASAFGLGPAAINEWSDFNCLVSFTDKGFIEVLNGSSYEFLNQFYYEANKRYLICISGNIDSLKYSVTAREEGGSVVVIAEDFDFRVDNYQGFFKYASILNTTVEGSLGVSNFQTGSELVTDHDNFSIKLGKSLIGDYAVKLRATPSSSNINGGIGLSKKKMTAWGDFNNIINFGPDGTIKIHNGSGYTNDTVFYYEGGQDYTFYIWGNTDSTTYNVKLVTADGQILDLATNYNFRLSNPGDTLNYVAQRIVYATKDNGIPDSYIAIDGIEYASMLDIDPFPMLALPQEMEIQTGSFSKTFVATPSSGEMDHSISFNSSSSVVWGDLSAIIRFEPGGKIDARNGGSYTAVNEVMYKAGQAYIFNVDFDVVANTYSVFVKSEIGATPDTIAFDYAFRKAPVDTLLYMTFKGNPSRGFLTYSEVGAGEYVKPEPLGIIKSFEIDSLTGDFNARFTVAPSAANIVAEFGLGPVSVSAINDFNCLIRFNKEGNIVAANGSNYEALTPISYMAGERYYFSMSGNVDSLKYSVTVREEGDTTVVLAEDFGFREDNYQGFLNYASQRAIVGSLSVSNFQTGSELVTDHDNFSIKLGKSLSGDYAVKLRATPSSSNINGGIGLSKKMVTEWGHFNNIINFGPDGTIKIHNGSGYSNDTVFYYEGGQDYTFYIWGNTDSTTYNVKLVTADGQILDLATNYNFRLSNPGDTLNYVAQRIVYATKDNGIPDSYIAIDGIEYGNMLDIDPFPMLALPQEMEIQTGSFSKTFVATPSSGEMDHSISFNSSSSVAWGDLSAIIRFAGGKIDARDGGSYTAVNEVMYKAGQAYIFNVDFDVVANTYSVFVKSEIGATPDTIAFDYAFRKAPVDTLMYMTFKGNPSGGFLTYSEVGFGEYINPNSTLEEDECFAPIIDEVSNIEVDSEAGTLTVNLSGIFNGGEVNYPLTVTAVSSNTSIIPNPTVSEVSEEGTAVLSYIVNSVDANTDITVTLLVSTECDLDSLGGAASVTTSFNIQILKTSLGENELSRIVLYPNPSSDFIKIENSASINRVEIYSVLGEKVLEQILYGKDVNEIKISSLNDGIYFIRCVEEDLSTTTLRFVKN